MIDADSQVWRASIDRYIRIEKWARKRYQDKNGLLLIGSGLPGSPNYITSIYSRIESAAWVAHQARTR